MGRSKNPGHLYTCDKCGIILFVEQSKGIFVDALDWKVIKFGEQELVLCPDCYNTFESLISEWFNLEDKNGKENADG